MNRNPEYEDMVNGLCKKMFHRKFSSCLDNTVCVRCKKPALSFKDEVSAREYEISGLCQKCQDWLDEGVGFRAPEYQYSDRDLNWSSDYPPSAEEIAEKEEYYNETRRG